MIEKAVRSVFNEAHAAGQRGEFWSEAWPDSDARKRLATPAKDASTARTRRDRVIYVFEEGLRAGMSGDNADTCWHHSYSRSIAADMIERAALND